MDTFDIALPREITFTIGKIDESQTVDITRLPTDVIAYLLRYGMKQRANDAHSALIISGDKKNAEPDDIRDVVDDVIAGWYSGEIRLAGERTTDPVRRLALDNAEKALAIVMGKRWANVGNKRALAADYVSRHPEMMEEARVQHERIAAMAAEIDVAAIAATPKKKKAKKAA